MALQNRVDPYGRLHAIEARGAWMGNRGALHDASKRVVAGWRSRRWITCVLSFRSRRRDVFAPRRYSELFFLDEATALSAGHRPCAECRRGRYQEFRSAWDRGRRGRDAAPPFPGADAIHPLLQEETLDYRTKRTYRAVLSTLPDGTMVEHSGVPHLVRARTLRPWSFAGYGPAIEAAPETEVAVLTPFSIVAAIREGFEPEISASSAPPAARTASRSRA
jgi:hypothetical protein